jgi:hypothetical protein
MIGSKLAWWFEPLPNVVCFRAITPKDVIILLHPNLMATDWWWWWWWWWQCLVIMVTVVVLMIYWKGESRYIGTPDGRGGGNTPLHNISLLDLLSYSLAPPPSDTSEAQDSQKQAQAPKKTEAHERKEGRKEAEKGRDQVCVEITEA